MLNCSLLKAWMQVGLDQESVKDNIEGLEVLDSSIDEEVQVDLNTVDANQVEYNMTFKSKRGLFHENVQLLLIKITRRLSDPKF